ncbi:nuclease-related domain-containing protein [Paenisporosarcina cavernae]|uniref:NERD domain-containing protein n=1 Tax=Paenisporosarcina cavernae TaxID=2320858 RepID=A0A385YPE2_9BACL|nr:nuclease-related domain-containing protein [Paenisporosarcina cavernae]AYC28579.1 NERD domain-containing protein [Paenisporosarcina cavernae]
MILKYLSEKSTEISALESALERLNPHHSSYAYLEQTLYRKKSGIAGELQLQKLLNTKTLLYDNFILFDLHLFSSGLFQIDCLLVTRSFVLVLEMKNIAGSIVIHPTSHNLERTRSDGQVNYMRNPFYQLRETMDLLEDFFLMNGINLPVKGVLVFRDANSALNVKENSLPSVTLPDLHGFLRRTKSNENLLTPEAFINVIDSLLTKHFCYIPKPISERFDIPKKDFTIGVKCPNCLKFGMKRLHGTWMCVDCKNFHRTAHISALLDYQFLFSKTISRIEMEKFLQCGTSTARTIVKNEKIHYEVQKNKKIYQLNSPYHL